MLAKKPVEINNYRVWAVSHGRPRQVDDVERDDPALEQSRLGHVLLDFGQDGDDADGDAEDHVERDVELVDGALPGGVAGVVDVEEHDGRDADAVEDALNGEKKE